MGDYPLTPYRQIETLLRLSGQVKGTDKSNVFINGKICGSLARVQEPIRNNMKELFIFYILS